jgi:hypothetical protein
MEESHCQLFKRLRFTPDQRTHMIGLWREWKRHRRGLDAQLDEVCRRLCALPDGEEISDSFVALVSSKCMGRPMHDGSMEMAVSLQPRSLLGLCPVATQAAMTAMRMLQEVQDRDARLQVRLQAVSHHAPPLVTRLCKIIVPTIMVLKRSSLHMHAACYLSNGFPGIVPPVALLFACSLLVVACVVLIAPCYGRSLVTSSIQKTLSNRCCGEFRVDA